MLETYFMEAYAGEGKLPLWVEYVSRGRHGDRIFHDHDFTELVIVMNGAGRHVVEDASAPVSKGDILLVHPGCVHAYCAMTDFEIVNIIYKHDKLFMPSLDCSSLPLFKRLFPSNEPVPPLEQARPVLHVGDEDLEASILLAKRLSMELRGVMPGKYYCALGLFMELITKLVRQGESEASGGRLRMLIGDAVAMINERYDSRLSIDELAARAKMSRRNFFRQFKLCLGCSPIEYLMDVRLKAVSEMLLKGDCTIEEIAFSCGFCDANYLCKKFREHYAMSPRQYRLNGGGRPGVKAKSPYVL